MRLQEIFSSKAVTQLGITAARYLPPAAGYGLARLIAGAIVRSKPALYDTVRANLRQICGPETGTAELDALTYHLFRHAGMTYYDFFHALDHSPAELARIMPIPQQTLDQIRAAQAQGKGVLILGIHMSNFDLAILSLGAHGLPIQALSLADPQAGFRILNRLRAEAGFEITPISPESLRAAIRRLRRGGIVMTGADRPIPEDRYLVPFFGRPAYLPLGPARLALLTDATVFLGACHYEAATGYQIEVLGPLEMARSDDRQADVVRNTRRLARFMEAQIRAYPEQWMMFHPFWPEEPAPETADGGTVREQA